MGLFVLVDNIILMDNDLVACTNFKRNLNKCFHIKDLETLKYFLGIVVRGEITARFIFVLKENMLWI